MTEKKMSRMEKTFWAHPIASILFIISTLLIVFPSKNWIIQVGGGAVALLTGLWLLFRNLEN